MRLARPGVTLVGMVVAAWIAAASVACGFSGNPAAIDGGAPADAGPDDPDGGSTLDGAAADARPSCFARWLAGPTFGPAVPVTAVNTGTGEADPFVTADERTLYVARSGNVFAATRATVGDPFGSPTQVAGLSSTSNDTKATITADGMTAFVNSSRPGGEGATDLWRGTRSSPSDAWVMDQIGLATVNTALDQWDPHVSGDGLRIYLAPSGMPQFVAVASRVSTANPFGAPVPIGEILSSAVDNDPSLTGDERVIVWASLRTGQRRMHYATRAGPTATFDPPQLLQGDFGVGDDGAALSGDGCRLYFVSSRAGNPDIYVAELE